MLTTPGRAEFLDILSKDKAVGGVCLMEKPDVHRRDSSRQNNGQTSNPNYEEAWDVKLARLGIKSIDSMWTIENENADSTLKNIKEDQDPDSGHQKSSGKSNVGNSSTDTLSSHSLTDEWEEKRSPLSPAIPPRLRRMSNSATQTDTPQSHPDPPLPISRNDLSRDFARMNSEPMGSPMSRDQAMMTSESMPRSRRHTTCDNPTPAQSLQGSTRPIRRHSKCNPLFQPQLMDRSLNPASSVFPSSMSQSVIVSHQHPHHSSSTSSNSNGKLRTYREEEGDTEPDLIMSSLHGDRMIGAKLTRNNSEMIRKPSLRRAISYGPNQNSRMIMQHSWMSHFDEFLPFDEDGSYFGTCDQMQMSSIIDPTKFLAEGYSLDHSYPPHNNSRLRRSSRRSGSVSSKSYSKGIKEGILNSSSFMSLKNHFFGSKEDEGLSKKAWFHARMTRQESEDILKNSPPGSYLVRKSETNKSGYSLSVKCSQDFLHMKIVMDKSTGEYILGEFSKPYRSISEMINHYTMNLLPIRGSSPILLKYPCCSLKVA